MGEAIFYKEHSKAHDILLIFERIILGKYNIKL